MLVKCADMCRLDFQKYVQVNFKKYSLISKDTILQYRALFPMSELASLRALVLALQREVADLREQCAHATFITAEYSFRCEESMVDVQQLFYRIVTPPRRKLRVFADIKQTTRFCRFQEKSIGFQEIYLAICDLRCMITRQNFYFLTGVENSERQLECERLNNPENRPLPGDLLIRCHPHKCLQPTICPRAYEFVRGKKTSFISRAGLEGFVRAIHAKYMEIDPPSADEVAKLAAHFEIGLA